MPLLVQNVPWPDDGRTPEQRAATALRMGVADVLSVTLVRRSLDARSRAPLWRAVLRVEVRDEARCLARKIAGVRTWTERDGGRYGLEAAPPRKAAAAGRPIVVGAGPAGLFASLWLAEAGRPPILLERGSPVEERVGIVNAAWRHATAPGPDDNVVYGEGGAGTFSDGKIYTRRRDGEVGWIFQRLIQFGADPEALQEAWAHLGTDRIRAILPPFRARLAELGADVRFHARVVRFEVEGGEVRGVELSDGTQIEGSPVIVAAGHSARDAMASLLAIGCQAEVRPIAVGVRIEHPQKLIDSARYGRPERGDLPPATYRLSCEATAGRKAHTFCMCPGGMVVPASAQDGHLVVNGMSFAARRAMWANSAVIVDVGPEDYAAAGARPGDPLAGVAFQNHLETRAFALTGGSWAAPASLASDFMARKVSSTLPRTSYPHGVAPADLWDLFPAPVAEGLVAALRRFDREVPGFAGPEAVLMGPESRTTSPVRFLRGPNLESVGVRGLFPCGEGAGYGGGIISCALDGQRVARAVLGD